MITYTFYLQLLISSYNLQFTRIIFYEQRLWAIILMTNWILIMSDKSFQHSAAHKT